MLASEYELQKEYDKAVERYRSVLAVSPDNAIALNNLAYALAVRKADAAGALPYAERAMRLTGGRSPEIADTLAWVQHLLGRDREAAEILARIVKVAPERPEYRLHTAVVFAALGRMEEAAAELAEALRLDPELEKDNEVKALRAKLGR
jgi:tetratricopeptide (TPR) repeat protein